MAELPPYYPGINYIFKLEKSKNGQEKNPLWGLSYGIIHNKLLVLRKTLNELLNKGFIRTCSSLAGAPVLFVKKKRGFWFYMDYWGLNDIIKKDYYSLPLIKETLSGILKIRYFIKLDITAVFYKICIAKGQKWIIIFRTRYGLFKYLVTLFGLIEAPVTFQWYINWVLYDYLNKFYTVYVDNILIYTSGLL